MTISVLAVIFLASLFVAILLGVPIAFALLFSAAVTGLGIGGSATNPQITAIQLMQGADSVTLMALPFFVLAGEFMNRGGLTKRIMELYRINMYYNDYVVGCRLFGKYLNKEEKR